MRKEGRPVKTDALQDVSVPADVPIQRAEQDRLRRVDFAGRIAHVLSELSPQEGRVFAIRGGWGFGKSSLKNLVIERLNAQGSGATWLDFNPWQWGDGDSIARALFSQIANKFGGEYSESSRTRADVLRRYGAILTGVAVPLKEASGSTQLISMILTSASVIAMASAFGFALPIVMTGAAILAGLSIVMLLVGRVFTHLGRDKAAEPLDKVRRTVEASLRDLDHPLIVFVDDIDRLEPEQIRMLLRQVKANANLPNIVFVLLFQPSIVERALDPVADGDGRAFLEKIVQTNFDLPMVPSSVVYRIFGDELSGIAGAYATDDNGFEQTRWGNVLVGCIQPRLHNLRDVRRLVSSVAVHLPLQVAGDVFEVNLIDFLALETLRVFEPGLHLLLSQERDLVLQSRRFDGDGRGEESRAAAQKLVEVVPIEYQGWAREILKELFPPLEWAFGGTNYSGGWQKKWLVSKQVCSARYFPRYFELQTPIGEISESAFVRFLATTADKDSLKLAIADIEAEGLLSSLVARFDESVDRLPVENADVLLPEMFVIGQKLVGTREHDPFSSPWVSAWRAVSWFLKRIPESDRSELVIEALKQSESLSVAAILIHLNDPKEQEEKKGQSFEPALVTDTVDALKTEWLRQIRLHAVEPGRLIAEKDLVSLLYRWRDYSESVDEPREWVTDVISTDQGFVTMVSRLMTRGMSHALGDRVGTSYNTFNRNTVEDFIGVEIAYRRSKDIDDRSFSSDSDILQTLQHHLEVWLGLRERDFVDPS